MKISQLNENLTPASTPSVKTIAPKFGRSDEMLESDCGTTGASAVATVSAPMGKMQKRGKGSMFQGISTSEKFANSRKAGIKESYYNHDDNRTGFSKPRPDVTGEDEPQGMFTVMINGRPWKEATSNEAFTMAQRVANKHPDKKVAVKWPTGQLNTVKAQGVAEGQQWPDSSNSLTKRSAVVTDLKGAPSKAGRGSGMTVATRVDPTITSTKVQRKDDRPIPSFLQKGVAEAGNKPLEKSRFGMGDTRTPRDIKSQMQGASDEFVKSTADKNTGPFHSKVAKMQGKMAKSELRKREQGVAEGTNDTVYPNAEVIKSKNGKPVGEIYQDGNSWGAFHYKADRGYDLIDSREEAIEALKDLHQETGRSRPDYTIKGVAEGNFPSTDELGDRAGAWRGRPEAAKPDFKPRMTKKGEVTKHEKSHQAQLKSMMQVKKAHGGLTGPKGQLPEQGVAEGLPKDPNAPKLVQDRKTGKWYDPNKEFDKKMTSPEVMAQMKRMAQKEGVAEEFNPEYDDEAGSAESNLHTIARAAQGLIDSIGENENLPEWCQEKIAKVEGMLVAVWDYLESQEEQGIDPQVDEDWNKVNHQDKTDGMSGKAVKAYRRENPGSKLKTAVTTKPSKLKAGSKDANRRKSFCARMSGNKGPMKDEKGRPTPKAKALSRWNCESVEQTVQMLESVQRDLSEVKQRLDPKCWKGFKKQGTKMKGGTRVNNCVPVSEAEVSEDKIASDLYKDFQIFKKGADKDIGSKAKDKGIGTKPQAKDIVAKEGAKVDRMVGHVKSSEKKLGHSDKEAENIAWATANKRGMLNNKNKK